MSSNLSFWLGLCPLTMAEIIVRKMGHYFTRKARRRKTQEERAREMRRRRLLNSYSTHFA
jgi:hypothetical protein